MKIVNPICPVCNMRTRPPKGYRKDGTRKHRATCDDCSNRRNRNQRRVGMKKCTKNGKCSICGFVAEHSCQLDIDHIDGNKKNNDLSNLQTLCANCHRLKTCINKDWEDKS